MIEVNLIKLISKQYICHRRRPGHLAGHFSRPSPTLIDAGGPSRHAAFYGLSGGAKNGVDHRARFREKPGTSLAAGVGVMIESVVYKREIQQT